MGGKIHKVPDVSIKTAKNIGNPQNLKNTSRFPYNFCCPFQIKWGPDMQDGEINFYSVSADGRVFNWVLMQNKLAITTIITLYLDKSVGGPDGTNIRLKGCGTCMVFHPNNPEIFQVGTEEGLIFKCSTAYSSKYLMTYNAHNLSVHRMDFNKFNSNIFASCSGDWRVKIWEDKRP